jgi:rhodanese-related sulfurtransferase
VTGLRCAAITEGLNVSDGVDGLLAEARRHLERLSPHAAAAALAGGAILVDIRSLEQRRHQGEVPGAAIVGRNVLEWRFDAGSHRIPDATLRRAVIVLCAEGYASSLAARSLQSLGWRAATDVVGGFEAWAAAGLPVRACAGSSGEGGGFADRRSTSPSLRGREC